ncbi:hypothetical protein Nepgr_011289 [Nepenthes gracilis]|uniref:Uncharacterized protein n=1 Tax=Nepenthes gracilis TaxID=150966 RepID=A0AAD3XLU1_NEPGR|nr:hypothetical protein Nepgr_011289 [Nepenthes gracilis]
MHRKPQPPDRDNFILIRTNLNYNGRNDPRTLHQPQTVFSYVLAPAQRSSRRHVRRGLTPEIYGIVSEDPGRGRSGPCLEDSSVMPSWKRDPEPSEEANRFAIISNPDPLMLSDQKQHL